MSDVRQKISEFLADLVCCASSVNDAVAALELLEHETHAVRTDYELLTCAPVTGEG